jgi:hypothetical protein
MIKLYRSMLHPKYWIASVPGAGWMAFPARDNGWQQRQAARGLDPLHLREVPIGLAANTGVPGTEPPQDLEKVA